MRKLVALGFLLFLALPISEDDMSVICGGELVPGLARWLAGWLAGWFTSPNMERSGQPMLFQAIRSTLSANG